MARSAHPNMRQDAARLADAAHAPQRDALRSEKLIPVEPRAGICFAAGCDLTMRSRSSETIVRSQRPPETYQRSVLRRFKGRRIQSLQLHSNGKVIASRAALEARNTGMPGATGATHKLDESSIPADEEMR